MLANIDFTSLVNDVIWIVVVSLVGFVWKKYIAPWLSEHHLNEAASIAVKAAEAVYGRYNGDQKLAYAINLLKEKGFNVNADSVIAAIKAAWKELDLAQISAGEKTVETDAKTE